MQNSTERGLEYVGKNDPCYAREVSPKKKKRFELKKTSAEYS